MEGEIPLMDDMNLQGSLNIVTATTRITNGLSVSVRPG